MSCCKNSAYYELEWMYCFKSGSHALEEDGCENFKSKEGEHGAYHCDDH